MEIFSYMKSHITKVRMLERSLLSFVTTTMPKSEKAGKATSRSGRERAPRRQPWDDPAPSPAGGAGARRIGIQEMAAANERARMRRSRLLGGTRIAPIVTEVGVDR